MLFNRSTVHSAKLKISELKQKYYSTDIILGENKRNNEFIKHVDNNCSNIKDVLSAVHSSHNKISPNSSETSIEHTFDHDERVLTQGLLERTIQTSSLEIKQNVGLSQINSNDESILNHGSIVSSSQVSSPRGSDNEKLSDDISQVVNQLENLEFISSSSDEQIKTITELSTPCEQQNLIQTTKDVVNEIQMLTNNGDNTIETITDEAKINALLEKSKNSEIGSSPSSRLKNMSDNGPLEYRYSNYFIGARSEKSLGNHKLSYLESPDFDKVSEVSTGSNKSIQWISNSCKRENMHNGMIKDQTRLKICKNALHNTSDTPFSCNANKGSNNAKNILVKQKFRRGFSSKYNKERVYKNLIYVKSNDSRENFQGTNTYKADESVIKHSFQHQRSRKVNMGFNQNIKRPVLRSNRLIKNTEQTQGMFCDPEKQAAIITKNTEKMHHPIKPSHGHEECEKTINNLLLNQIQLTRHFIDSHHKIYLLCCQAAQKLSEDYVRGSDSNKNTTR